ncbi:hypothetical protein HY798_00895 [Candidatus Falkowbacteria bacterium]|nr:hypothetical protein [Candidatus Falkowbacteria bacterium]
MENYKNKLVKTIERGDVVLTVLLVALGLLVGFVCSFVYYNFVKVPSLMEQSTEKEMRTQLAYASLVANSNVQLFDCVVEKIDGNTLVGKDFLGDHTTRSFLISDRSKFFKREILRSSASANSFSSKPGEIKLSEIKVGDTVHIEAKKQNENNEYPAEKVFLIVLK